MSVLLSVCLRVCLSLLLCLQANQGSPEGTNQIEHSQVWRRESRKERQRRRGLTGAFGVDIMRLLSD